MGNLVDRHIWDRALKEYNLHRNQHAYQIGKSTEAALHNVVTLIKNASQQKDIALGALLDIEGAFERTSFEAIKQAAERHGIESTVCRWNCAMLYIGNISTT
jgi:beta-phosphoglucomutase-like phosphatase (HAD superfamily)